MGGGAWLAPTALVPPCQEKLLVQVGARGGGRAGRLPMGEGGAQRKQGAPGGCRVGPGPGLFSFKVP